MESDTEVELSAKSRLSQFHIPASDTVDFSTAIGPPKAKRTNQKANQGPSTKKIYSLGCGRSWGGWSLTESLRTS